MNTTRDAFFQKLEENPELQKKVESIQQPSIEAAAEEIASIARDSGFDLTAQDFLPQPGELAENELAGVSGGAAGDFQIFESYNRDWKWKATENEAGKLKWEKIPR